MGFEATVMIARPVEDVWAFMTDWSRAHEWMNGVDSIEPVGGKPVEEGSTIRFHARGAERSSILVGWQPPRTMVLQSRQGGVTATYAYSIAPAGDGARVTLRADCAMRGAWKLLGPLIRFMMKRVDGKQPEQMKRLMLGD